MSKLIIDVSYHNGVINWEKVKASGCAGAILRCGYGDDIASQDDKQWIRNLAECERLGIPVGVYLYSYATCDRQAQSELDHIMRLIKGHTFQLPIFIDVEEPGTQGYAPKACEILIDHQLQVAVDGMKSLCCHFTDMLQIGFLTAVYHCSYGNDRRH